MLKSSFSVFEWCELTPTKEYRVILDQKRGLGGGRGRSRSVSENILEAPQFYMFSRLHGRIFSCNSIHFSVVNPRVDVRSPLEIKLA
jgi:hypothetical protein